MIGGEDQRDQERQPPKEEKKVMRLNREKCIPDSDSRREKKIYEDCPEDKMEGKRGRLLIALAEGEG